MRRRVRVWWVLPALLLAVALVAAACDGNGDDGDDGDGTPEQTDASPVDGDDGTPPDEAEILTPEEILAKDPDVTNTAVIEWGYMFEETGPLAGFGDPAGDGVQLAVEEINAAGGFQVGDTIYTIELIERDTKSDVSETIAVTQGLIVDDDVNVIWGPASVGDAESLAFTSQSEVLHLCPCPAREVTSLETVEQAERESRFAFQTLPAPSKFLPPGAIETREDYPQFETFATICAATVVGEAFCDFFKEAYEDAGFEFVRQELFPASTTDFTPFLTNLKEDDPDLILNFVDAGPEQFDLLRQSWELDVGEFYIGVAIPYELFEALVGSGIRDKIVSAGATPRTHAIYTSEKSREFFEDKYKPFLGSDDLPPAAFVAMINYDPVYMLIAAMQRAGTVDDTTAIAQALEEIHLNGSGEDNLFFDDRHLIVSGVDTCIIHQGEMTCEHRLAPELVED